MQINDIFTMSLSSQRHKLLYLYSHVFFQLIYKYEYTVCIHVIYIHIQIIYMSSTFLLSWFLYISYSFCCYREWRCVHYIVYMIILKLLLSCVFYILLLLRIIFFSCQHILTFQVAKDIHLKSLEFYLNSRVPCLLPLTHSEGYPSWEHSFPDAVHSLLSCVQNSAGHTVGVQQVFGKWHCGLL